MKIYFKGTVGAKGAFDLLDNNRELVEKRFPRFFIEQTERLLSPETLDKITIEKCDGCNYICNVTEGGIFNALWESCAAFGAGCEVFLKKIPLRQEIVEICELFDENPYELDSEGSLLIFVEEDGNSFENSGQTAFGTLIGYTTKKKDRVIIDGESRRFLTPPQRQKKDINNRKTDRNKSWSV